MTLPMCRVCAGPTTLLGSQGSRDYLRCPTCGAVSLNPFPTAVELEGLYADSYASSGHYGRDPVRHNRARRRVFTWVADHLTKLGDPPGHVIEVGAGWGGLAEVLTGRGFSYEGWEPSPQMARVPASKGLPVCVGTIEDAVASGSKASVVVACAVYEHLPDQDSFLRDALRLLDADGHIVLQGPTAAFPSKVAAWHRRIAPRADVPSVFGSLSEPWHVGLPTPASIRIQAARQGLELVRVDPSPSGRSGGATSLLQLVNDLIGRGGFLAFGERWPLVMAHVFTLRKTSAPPSRR